MELRTVNMQEANGSCFVTIPIAWIKMMSLKKGDKMVWSVNEGNHDTLHLTKKSNKGDNHE